MHGFLEGRREQKRKRKRAARSGSSHDFYLHSSFVGLPYIRGLSGGISYSAPGVCFFPGTRLGATRIGCADAVAAAEWTSALAVAAAAVQRQPSGIPLLVRTALHMHAYILLLFYNTVRVVYLTPNLFGASKAIGTLFVELILNF